VLESAILPFTLNSLGLKLESTLKSSSSSTSASTSTSTSSSFASNSNKNKDGKQAAGSKDANREAKERERAAVGFSEKKFRADKDFRSAVIEGIRYSELAE
jgi:hypothetical protein